MKLKPNLVSVILPVNNAEDHLAECLHSLLFQTYKDIEIIAIDDHSKDSSWQILRRLQKQDSRLRIYRNIKKYGLTVTLNRAVKYAKGSYIAFMRASDKAGLHRIKRQVSYLQDNPKTVAVGVQMTSITHAGKDLTKTSFPLLHDAIYQTLIQSHSFHYESALINRSILPLDILKFTETAYPHVYSALLLKLTQYGQLANLNQYLYSHREDAVQEKRKQSHIDTLQATLKLWITSVTQYDYRPTLRSLFTQFAK